MFGITKDRNRTLKERCNFVDSLRGMVADLERTIAEKDAEGVQMRAARLDGDPVDSAALAEVENEAGEARRELAAVRHRLESAQRELDSAINARRVDLCQQVQDQLDAITDKQRLALQRIGDALLGISKDLIKGHCAEQFVCTSGDGGFRDFMTSVIKCLERNSGQIRPFIPSGIEFSEENEQWAKEEEKLRNLRCELGRCARLTAAELIGQA